MLWFRARARALALALLVSLGTLGASSALPHADDCHELCIASLVPHDPSRHAITVPSSPGDHPLHCVVCHWTRLLRPPVDVVHQFAAATEGDGRVPADVVRMPSAFRAAQPPLRSPPPAHIT